MGKSELPHESYGRVIIIVCSNYVLHDMQQCYSTYYHYITGSPHNEGSDSTTDGLSAGAAAAIAVALTLLVALPVGVVIGYFGTWWQRRGLRGQGTQHKQEQLELDKPIYEEPGTGPVDTAIPLSENWAYGQVNKQKN